MKNEIFLFGEVGWELTMQSVIDQVKNTDPNEPLIINIHSVGGSVYEGLAIYNYLKNLGREIHTTSTGIVASIASIIYLAGTKRTFSETGQFLVHLPMGWADGNAEEIKKTLEELEKIEGQLADIYASETDLTKDEALILMKEDEFSEIKFLQDKKFITDLITLKAVATLNINKNKKDMSETVKIPKSFWKKIENLFKNEPVAIMVTLEDGTKLDFEREEGEPQVGDKATLNGEVADGNYTLPNGTVYNFVDGELKTITEKEADEDSEASLTKEDVTAIVTEALKPVLANVTAMLKDSKKYKSTFESLGNIVASTGNKGKQTPKSASEPSGEEQENVWDILTEN